MTDQERAHVLKMIADGKITPEEGLRLMQALDQNPAEDEMKVIEPEAGPGSAPEAGAEKPEEKAEKTGLEADPKWLASKPLFAACGKSHFGLGSGLLS